MSQTLSQANDAWRFILTDQRDGSMGFSEKISKQIVQENRRSILDVYGFALNQLICMEQVHGKEIRRVGSAESGCGAKERESSISGVDGIYTTDQQVVLTALGADCPLVGLAHRDPDMVAVMHSGWRSTAAKIVPQMVQTLQRELRISVSEMCAYISVAAGSCCYEVKSELLEKVPEFKPFSLRRNGQLFLDLVRVLKHQLMKFGVNERNIQIMPGCTMCGSSHFSFRRQAQTSGRHALFAWLKTAS